jgi:Rne/Rng family ribonuclease
MASELLINVSPYESRVALLENGNVVELYIEREAESSLIGNIYKGRVIKVLPGMGAAFVDIGLERSAFLYVADVVDHYDDFLTEWQKDDNGGNHVSLTTPFVSQTIPVRQGRPSHLAYHITGQKFSFNADSQSCGRVPTNPG